MIKVGVKGRIIKGAGSPIGEILVVDDRKGTGGYYVYVWPNDGSKWPGTDKPMIYDAWLEDWDWVESYFEQRNREIEWYDNQEPDEVTKQILKSYK